jgi:hypothetical protein
MLFALRLKIVNQKISQIETMVVKNTTEGLGFKFANLKTPNPAMTKVPEASKRNTRRELIDIAQLYPKGLRAGSFDSVDVPFVPNVCYRVENGMNTAGVGSSSLNMLTQKFPFMPEVFDKVTIVDEELGIVVIRMNFGKNSIDSKNKEYLEVWEAFKIYNDSMYAVEAFMQKVPAGTVRTDEALFGWKYDDISAEVSIAQNSSLADRVTPAGKVIATTKGISIPLRFFSDKVSLDLYDV